MKLRLGVRGAKKKDPLLDTSSESLLGERLKELSGGDAELYGALSRLMFLDPKKITTSLDRAVNDAQSFEAQGDKLRAEVGYRIAGGISLSKGDTAGVRTYFGKAASIAGNLHPEYEVMVKRGDEVVAIARKFYEEFPRQGTQ